MTFNEMNGSFDIQDNRGSVRDPMGTPESDCLESDELVSQYASVHGCTDEEVISAVEVLEQANPGLLLHGPNPYPDKLRYIFMRNALTDYFRGIYAIILGKTPRSA